MTGEQVKISVIIPVFNDEDFLAECLESILNQTMKEIEVICVDDASTDNSAEIIKKYAQRDRRIRPVFYETNKSASQGRKDGVLLSRGEYVLFVDGDDFLAAHACEELYQEMKADPVDILHFGTEILNWSGVDEARIEAMRRLLAPYQERLEGSQVFEECFCEQKYGFSLWNKLYEGTLCRRAMSHIEDGLFPKAQDKYAFFVISYFAKSYRGIDKEYYTYRFGSGITGHITLTLKMFQRYCTMGKVADAMENFIRGEGVNQYTDALALSRKQLLNDVLANWMRVRNEQRAEAFDRILDYWHAEEVIAALADKYWYNQGTIAQSVKGAQVIKSCPRAGKIKTIGAYYLRLYGGGAQRVMAMLANIWRSMGYQVVLFTDCEENEEDYYLVPGIERVALPPSESMNRKAYGERAAILQEEIKKHNVDVMIYHSWVSNILLWDMLICKVAGAAFAVHCHSIFPLLVRNFHVYFSRMTQIYQLCDAVVTLSETDRRFWGNFNANVFEVKNPLFFDPAIIVPSGLQNKNIVWIGRFSIEKHPQDAMVIMRKVVAVDPEVKLFMLGELTEGQRESYTNILREMGLENNVELVGYLNDVSPYLKQASLQLMTSEYEGYPLALLEGMAYGLPFVMYELPYLTLVKDNKGIASVGYKDTAAAATEILEIMGDEEKRKEMGRNAYAYVKELGKYNIKDKWQEIFGSFEQAHEAVDQGNLLMFNTLMDFYEVGSQRAAKNRNGGSLQAAAKSMLTRKVVFWGAGRRAWRFLDEYENLNISFCIDSDSSKDGSAVKDIPVVHPSHIEEWRGLFIIVTIVARNEITQQLKQLGLQYGTDFVYATDILTLKE